MRVASLLMLGHPHRRPEEGGSLLATLTKLTSLSTATGSQPYGGFIADAAGDLFGTTQQGGTQGGGTVFEIVAGDATFTPITLVNFSHINGATLGPDAGLVMDSAGDLFGTTQQGGVYGLGTIFEIPKTSIGYGAPVILVSFNHQDGAWPEANLTIDSAGNLFGTTLRGNTGNGGVVFELFKTSSGYASDITALDIFAGPTGADPQAGLISDSAGNLFGTTSYGGSGGAGTAIEMVNNGNGTFTPVVLANFAGSNGSNPAGGLVMDAAGDLFGTTSQGGTNGELSGISCAAGRLNMIRPLPL
jgi:uncharacterized repeat protein (TIGR03803 family)